MSPSTSFNPRATGSQLRLVRALTEAAGVSGAENAVRAIVRAEIEAGDRVTFATPFRRIGPSIRAKALDDRLGVAALIELIQQAPDGIELQAAFTVQEEIGQSGARVAAQAFDPDIAVILDCTAARDLPGWDGSENRAYNAKVGAGAVIY